MRFKALVILSLFVYSFAVGQPTSFKLTEQKNQQLVPVKVQVPEKFSKQFSKELFVNLPKGYSAKIFYAGNLKKPRFMAWGPDSVLYVANLNSGKIIALPDKNRDGVADTSIVAVKDAYGHDVKFFNGAMYVVQEQVVEKFDDKNGDGIYETRSMFIDSILPGLKRPPGGHTTRTMVFDEQNKCVYLSVGSKCNVCREDERAVIYKYDLNGKNKQLFASGTRNCVGMCLNPETGKLWATNNGSDHQGNDIPPEWIDVVVKDGFYGYPFAYAHKVYFDFKKHDDYKKLLPLTAMDSALVNKMKKPAALVQAHSAPMAIEFSNASFRQDYRKGAFVAYRGSWDRNPPTGYKVVFLDIHKSDEVSAVSDFMTGFYNKGEVWARPVGIQVDKRGRLYMSSDAINEFILVVYPD